MKAKMRYVYADKKWWCCRMGVTGCGETMEEAYNDMLALYRDAVRPMTQEFLTRQARA